MENNNTQQENNNTSNSESGVNNKHLVLGLAIGIPVLIGLLIGGYFFIKSSNKKNDIQAKKELREKKINDSLNLIANQVRVDSVYYIILGSYTKERNAEKHQSKSNEYSKLSLSELGTFRVKNSEKYDNFAAAHARAMQLRSEGVDGAWVYQIPKSEALD